MIYLYLFGTCFHFIYVFMIIGNINTIIRHIQTKKQLFNQESIHHQLSTHTVSRKSANEESNAIMPFSSFMRKNFYYTQNK